MSSGCRGSAGVAAEGRGWRGAREWVVVVVVKVSLCLSRRRARETDMSRTRPCFLPDAEWIVFQDSGRRRSCFIPFRHSTTRLCQVGSCQLPFDIQPSPSPCILDTYRHIQTHTHTHSHPLIHLLPRLYLLPLNTPTNQPTNQPPPIMKGLFPTAQLGAHYLNANNNNNHHNNHIRHVPGHTPSRHHNNNQDIVMLCSKCGESIEPSGMTSRTWLAATTNCICILLMYGAAYVVKDLEHDYRSAVSSAAGTAIKKPILISLAVFLFCAVSHLVIAHDIVGMSLRRMLFWGTNVGAAGAASAIILCTICFPHLRAGRWLMAMHFAMWGWTVALSAVYVFEALRLHRMPKKESECTETRNEKAAFVMTE